MLALSGANCGARTLRSSGLVSSLGSARAAPAVGAGTSAKWLVAYQSSFGSGLVTYAIHLPSGLQAGWPSSPGLAVTWTNVFPLSGLSAATTHTLVS